MARTPILNANRIVIGYIEEQGGGKQKALDRNAMLLGYYDLSTNSVNRRPKRTPYRRPKGTPFVERRDGYDGRFALVAA